MFNFKLYQHQKLSFYMNAIFPMVLKIVTVILSKIEYLLIFGIKIYLHLILLRSIVKYANCMQTYFLLSTTNHVPSNL